MPLIEKPKDGGPVFGTRAQVVIGGPLVHQLRDWNRRKGTSSADEDGAEDAFGANR